MCARAKRTRIDHARVCVRIRALALYARARSVDMKRTGKVSENYTLLSYSPRCIRAYPLSILGQVFTLASRQQPSYVCRRTSDIGDRARPRRNQSNPFSGTENICHFFLKSILLIIITLSLSLSIISGNLKQYNDSILRHQ